MEANEQRKVHGDKATAGVAYIYIPSELDREKYIRDAYRTNSVSIINDFSERMDNVRIAQHVMNDLEFPKDSETLGSMVIWVNIPRNNQPIIVAVVPKGNEISDLLEHQFTMKKTFGNTSIDISGDAENGRLIVNVFSKEKSPRIDINASTPNKDAEVNINVSGDLNAIAEGKVGVEAAEEMNVTVVNREEDEEKITTLKYVRGKGLNYKDEFDNEIIADKDKVRVGAAKSVMLGDGDEPLVLGDTLSTFLEDILTAISSITVATSIGAQPVINKATFEQLKQQVNKIKSEYSSTD